jgi:hypothetical protein
MKELKEKFIVDEEIDEKRIEELVERALLFCKVTKNGSIIIESTELSSPEKIKLALVARFLANKLDSSISPEVNGDELSSSLMIAKDQVSARLKDAKDEKFAQRTSKGVYAVNPLKIGEFLTSLENKYKARK